MNTELIQPGFVWQVRVYWEDTDGGGVVYHARYLNLFERARTEWLRQRGVHQSELSRDAGVVFAIRSMNIDWLAPARLDDLINVSVHSVNAGASKLTFQQDMHRDADKQHLASASVTAVCLDAKAFKPIKMPEWIRLEINDVE